MCLGQIVCGEAIKFTRWFDPCDTKATQGHQYFRKSESFKGRPELHVLELIILSFIGHNSYK